MEPSATDYQIFKRKVRAKTGLDLDAYKQTQMERRLRSFMDRAGAQNFQQYYSMLEMNERLLREFMDRVTINVSEMFRNPEQFDLLEQKVIPELLKHSRSLRVWSAGCSYGQEPHSLAICLEEAAAMRGHKIIATDIDDRALAQAKAGSFSELDVRNLSQKRRDRWFSPVGERFQADPRLTRMIEFRKLDLLKDVFPATVDLILCRNVVIYFTDEAKDQLYRRFFTSLKPGGYLFVGGTERINGYQQIGFENPYPFFYRKPLST